MPDSTVDLLIQQLQQLRMLIAWPLLVGSCAGLTVRLVLKLVSPRGKVSRVGVYASGLSAGVGLAVAASIGRRWDDGLVYWAVFTLGLFALAIVLVTYIAITLLEDFHDSASTTR